MEHEDYEVLEDYDYDLDDIYIPYYVLTPFGIYDINELFES